MDKLNNSSGTDKLYQTLIHYPKGVIVSTLMYLNYKIANQIFTEDDIVNNTSSNNEVGGSIAERVMLLEILDIALEEYEKRLESLEKDNMDVVH